MNYFGPSNTSLDIRVYSGREMILSVSKAFFRNSFSTSLYVYEDRIRDPEIVIEARIGSQDYQQIANQIVELHSAEIQVCTSEKIVFYLFESHFL